MATKVMLVEDHRLMREVLMHLLSGEADLEVVAAAADAPEALALARDALPDVVVMDIELPGISGIVATRALVSLYPACHVVMLSASCSEQLIRASADAGACGYLLKGDPPPHLSAGIRAAARGDHPMAPQVRALCLSMRQASEGDRTSEALSFAAWCHGETS